MIVFATILISVFVTVRIPLLNVFARNGETDVLHGSPDRNARRP